MVREFEDEEELKSLWSVAIYVYSYYICVPIRTYMCPHSMYVSSYYYIYSVYVCPHYSDIYEYIRVLWRLENDAPTRLCWS